MPAEKKRVTQVSSSSSDGGGGDRASIFYHEASDRRLVMVRAPTKECLDNTLMRLSIYYEHPVHRGVYLTRQQFADISAKKPFVYWGHNMSLAVVCSFLNAARAQNDLGPDETLLLRQLTAMRAIKADKKFIVPAHAMSYLVGFIAGDVPTLLHEMHHAFYYFHPDYRAVATQAFKQVDKMMRLQVHAYLKSCGYCEDVWEDEFQAHLCLGDQMIIGKGMAMMDPSRQLLEEFKRHYASWFAIDVAQ
ncbi:enhancer of mRNA decapping [Sorochytrium milnesiophthora]